MNRETINYKDEAEWLALRKADITSTDVSSLYNLNPRKSYYALYQYKSGAMEDTFQGNEFTRWGNRLEEAIAYGLAEDNDWTFEPFKSYMRIPEIKAGSSFDFKITKPLDAILEIKNMDSFYFNQSWVENDEGVLEPPYHIQLQCQHQMMVSGYQELYLGALVGGNKSYIVKINADIKVHDSIHQKIEEFWHRIEMKDEPSPEMAMDYDIVKSLYGSVEPDKVLDKQDDKELNDLILQYQEFSAAYSEAGKMKEACMADILSRIGDAELAIAKDFKIKRTLVNRKAYTVEAKQYVLPRISKVK